MSRTRIALAVVALLGLLNLPAFAADWPMWRNDANRSAASAADLPDELHLRWVNQYTPREPVWDDPLNHDLMPYDRVFEPVVSGNTLILGFNDSNKIVALDTDTGSERWTYYVDGPVRFPSAVADGKVYFTSDDGYLYCVGIKRGDLKWKFRGGPRDRKILGNKRLISTWPARGGAAVKDGVVYFAASIWPMMGTFIYALDAETGDIIWKNDGTSADYIKQPHNSPAFAGIGPQGAMVVSGDRLLVPGGRSVPACFDLKTGELLYFHFSSQNKTGGAFVAAIDDVFFNHYREGVTNLFGLDEGEWRVGRIGTHPVLTSDTFYFSGANVQAWNTAGLREKKPENRGDVRWQEAKDWELEVDATGDLIKAGGRLYAAGEGAITAIDVTGAEPSIAWRKRINKTFARLVAADDKLFAVTEDGQVMAFGEQAGTPKQDIDLAIFEDPSEHATQRALDVLERTGVTEGYALVHGISDVDFLTALANRSELHIFAFDPDAEKVNAARETLDALGIYGTRVDVQEGNPFSVELPPYLASLTIVDGLDPAKFPRDQALLARVFHSVRPYGGKVWITPPADASDGTFAKLVASIDQAGATVVAEDAAWIVSREGSLPDSGTWTHNYGNIANTTKSDDALVKLPLGVLWFGGSSNLDVLPRHGHGPPEQVIGGRLFIQGMTGMSARDVYTGRVLWRTELQDLGTYGVYFDETYKDTPTNTRYNQVHIPGANIRGTNYVATEDRLYVIQGGATYVLNAHDGDIVKTISLPPVDPDARRPKPPPWGYIGVHEDKLIGGNGFVAYSDLVGAKKEEYSIWTDFDKSASKGLLVFDRYEGDIKWRVDATHGFLHNGIAVGGDTIFILDKLPRYIENQLKRRGKPVPDTYRLTALNVHTGEPKWEETENIFGSFLAYSEEHDILMQTSRPSKDTVRDEDGNRMIAYQGKDGTVLWEREVSYSSVPILHGAKIVTQDGMVNLLTGEPVMRVNPITGIESPWEFDRHYGCNYPIASDNLLTFRSAAAGFYDFANDGGTGNFGGFKSSCTANLVPAEGVLNAPDYTRTCSCSYQNQTSLALVHMPDTELWTFNPYKVGDAPVKRVGINFGAPGDRMADDGTLWLDYPSVGGPSPEVAVEGDYSSGEEPGLFRNHASVVEGDAPEWVVASGIRDVQQLRIKLASAADTSPRSYTVRLHFAEPDSPESGHRVFDVALQGETVLKDLDVAKEAGGSNHGIVREFSGVSVTDELTIAFTNTNGNDATPVISGVEVSAEGE
jgi:outer membrane protein assembly factor BamB